jgi:hypothetical protein
LRAEKFNPSACFYEIDGREQFSVLSFQFSAGRRGDAMTTAKCSCEKFLRLEGASATAYAAAFLEDVPGDSGGRKLLRCRVCGRLWEKRAPEVKSAGSTRPSLVRLD